jgi:hypothetical protein
MKNKQKKSQVFDEIESIYEIREREREREREAK